jgi:NADPH-dependent 2,4-dienoyl-CoA reductase/sulfur reductase-like enzyme
MSSADGVVVVGASAAGLAAAEALRRNGFDGGVTLVGAEAHRPYDRPPLSKQVLSGAWEVDRVELRAADAYTGLDIELVLGTPASGLDVDKRRLHLGDRTELPYDRLIIATGVAPRRVPGAAECSGVHVLKTIDDALALKDELVGRPRVVVVGGGFLGTEIAATARGLGLDVTIVYPASHPLERQLGATLGALAERMHLDHGVRLRPRTLVSRLIASGGKVRGVECSDGAVVRADVVVVCIGSDPAIDWLAGSGLSLTNGVVCDEFGQCAPGVYAAGDVAAWLGPDHRHRRVEHRTNAAEQGGAVASHLLGLATAPHQPVAFYWTDQHDARIQVHGALPAGGQLHVIEGSLSERRFVGLWGIGGRAVGVIGWNLPKAARLARQRVVDGSPLDSVPLAVAG